MWVQNSLTLFTLVNAAEAVRLLALEGPELVVGLGRVRRHEALGWHRSALDFYLYLARSLPASLRTTYAIWRGRMGSFLRPSFY